MEIDECLEKGFLRKIKPAEDIIEKEVNEGNYDFIKAQKAFDDGDYKWGIVKAYYSMFHYSRAILFKSGLREKKHFAISIVLENMNKKGKLESKYVNDFNAAISAREDADYHYIYSKEKAQYSLSIAKEFNKKMLELLK